MTKKLLVLVEPYYHGIQYLDVAETMNLDFLVLKRKNGPTSERYKKVVEVDFTDTEDAYRKVRKYCDQYGFSRVGIIPGNDFVVEFSFSLSEKFNLNYNSANVGLCARNKYEMFKAFNKNLVNCPNTIKVNNLTELLTLQYDLKYPVIVKPADMSSSMYVTKANNEEELISQATTLFSVQENVLNYEKTKYILIQEFIVGKEFSVELFFENNESVFSSITQKIKTEPPFFVELGHVVPASNINNKEEKIIIDEAIKAAKAIGLKNGPAHVELIIDHDIPYIIEIASRIGGDNIMKLLKLSFGIYFPQIAIQQVLDIPIQTSPIFYKAAAISFFVCTPGKIVKIMNKKYLEEDTRIVDISIGKSVGDIIHNLESSEERVGYFIVQTDSPSSALNAIEELKDVVKFEVTQE